MEKQMTAQFDDVTAILELRLSGELDKQDIENWKVEIERAVDQIPSGSRFKALINIYGFKAKDMEVHRAFRNIVPLLLANFHYRIGYLDMFPEAQVELKSLRGIRCVAMANVHQDESKMNDYQQKFGRTFERYFTDQQTAWRWLRTLEIK